MTKRIRMRKKGPLKKKHIFLIVFIFMLIISVQGFLYVERNLEPVLEDIARTYVKQLATLAINDAISKKISEEMSDDSSQMFTIEKNADDEIELLSFDQAKQAKIVTLVTDRAHQILLELSKEPVPLPLGQALNSNILAQLGPDIPITLVPMGAAKAEVKVLMEEAGINMVTIIANLKIEADVRIVIPFSSAEAIVTTEVPVSVVTVPGKVPEYYFRGGDNQQVPLPHISIPGSEEEDDTGATGE
jgi:sporulation protein YunB